MRSQLTSAVNITPWGPRELSNEIIFRAAVWKRLSRRPRSPGWLDRGCGSGLPSIESLWCWLCRSWPGRGRWFRLKTSITRHGQFVRRAQQDLSLVFTGQK